MSSSKEVIGSILETFDDNELEWRINICSNNVLEKETGEYLDSPAFLFSFCTWCIRMYPNGNKSSNEGWISLFLRKKGQPEKYVSFSIVMTFQGIELPAENNSVNKLFIKGEHSYGWPKYILRKEVLDHWSKEAKSCCQLTIKMRLRNLLHQNEDALLRVKRKGRKILCQNYKDLLLHGEDHDLVLKVKDKEFKAHRYIMQFRCPVFKSMLSHEMVEKNSGIVEIPDCDPFAFEQFLIYIYTGELEKLDESTMLGLYFIADKYDMENLKEECSAFIKTSLSVDVICDVIKLALNHSDSVLLELATKYFLDNTKEILVTEEWQNFLKEYTTQANELFIKAFDKCSQCCSLTNDYDDSVLLKSSEDDDSETDD